MASNICFTSSTQAWVPPVILWDGYVANILSTVSVAIKSLLSSINLEHRAYSVLIAGIWYDLGYGALLITYFATLEA